MMHWVGRGSEPDKLKQIRSVYTAGWVQYYRDGIGSKPKDSRWREFHDEAERVFRGLCAYCEQSCRGEIDHYRPKSRFPKLVYEWYNWLFACHDCNQAKNSRWPTGGYVDPCAKSQQARPERYFTFDTQTGEILPRRGLSLGRRKKAWRTIDILQLNGRHHLRNRVLRLRVLSAYEDLSPLGIPRTILAILVSRSTALSSVTRTWLFERGYSI